MIESHSPIAFYSPGASKILEDVNAAGHGCFRSGQVLSKQWIITNEIDCAEGIDLEETIFVGENARHGSGCFTRRQIFSAPMIPCRADGSL